jgi:transcriptional regulatory protein LevR
MNLPNFENNAEKQIKWLKTQLSITQAETQVIKSEKENLEEELQEVEYQVRLEAAEEIQAQLQVMRDEYNAMYLLPIKV